MCDDGDGGGGKYHVGGGDGSFDLTLVSSMRIIHMVGGWVSLVTYRRP